MSINDFLFVAFNCRVVALHKQTGEIVWDWKAPHGSGFVTLLVEGDHVYVSVNGYTYCLDAANGAQLWYNQLSGFGTGVACLATTSTSAAHAQLGQAAAEAARRNSAAGAC